jgi:hypothetical protein
MKAIKVFFTSQGHERLHTVLLAAGFHFEVTPDMRVTSRYRHPDKPYQVELREADEEVWAEVSNLDPANKRILSDQDYSVNEWEWLDQAGDDEAEFLRRELHILIRVRPNYLVRPS